MLRIKYPLSILCSLVAIALIAGLMIPQPAQAIEPLVSLTATPAVLDAGGKPGDEVKVSFQLTNNADTVLPIHMTSRDSLAKDGQSPELVYALSARDWIQFDEPDFILEAKETKIVEARFFIPKDAPSGGHYADLITQTLSLEGADEFITAKPELAVQMLISVVGTIKEDLSITQNGPSTIITQRSSKDEMAFTVKNLGNIHTLFYPRVHLLQGKSDLGAIEAQPAIILPSEEKRISFSLPDNIRPGIYRIQARYSYGAPSKEATSAEIRVIVLPFRPIFLLFIPAIVITVYLFRARRRLSLAIKAIAKGESANFKK